MTLLLLEDIVDWELKTSSATCFIKAYLGETLRSRTRTMFSSNLRVRWCKSARLVHSWFSDQNWLIGIETQHLFQRSFSDWLVATNRWSITLLNKHQIQFLKVWYPGPTEAHKIFERWVHKISLLSKCSNHFPTNGKVFSFSLSQKTLSDSSANVL